MNSKKLGIIAGTLLLVLLAGYAWGATDYASMSTEELSALRGTMYNKTQEERNAFRDEWMKRVQEMTQEEREQYLSSGPGNGGGRGNGTGLGNGTGQGGGNGQGNGGGYGKGKK